MSETTIYDFHAKTIAGEDVSLADYRGRVLLVVNTASKCRFTGQYEGLEKLYRQYGDEGLVVLGFPCNQFGAQEPEGDAAIAQFCCMNYGVSFPMFGKVDVNGPNADPLFRFLKHEKRGLLGTSDIKWNFTKFLVNRHGKVVRRYSPLTPPADLDEQIGSLLKEPGRE